MINHPIEWRPNPGTLIGVAGKKGSGKDEFAKVANKHGFRQIRFADALKGMMRFLLTYQGVDDVTAERMIDGDLKESPTPYLCGKTPRHAMQTLGTEWRDTIATNLWTNISEIKIAKLRSRGECVVVSDVRFPHEVDLIHQLGGLVIRVERPVGRTDEGTTHISEMLIDSLDADVVIRNTGSLEHYRALVEDTLHATA